MRRMLLAALLLAAGWARAGEPDDADALTLADSAPTSVRAAGDWHVFAEMARVHSVTSGSASPVEAWRGSVDLLYDARPANGLRVVLSDRLDLTHASASPHEGKVNTLREAYVSWQRRPDQIIDVGRVNLRFGAASGYNPTDFFKAGALRSIVSPAPSSLRENRLGTVLLQGQHLWSGGSFAAIYSPRLANAPTQDAFSPDWGATNPRHRWLLAGSQRLGDAFSPQFLLFGGEGLPTQAGLNASGLVNQATVAYVEAAVGDGRSLRAQALALPEANRWQRRASIGFTTTTDFNLSFTAEAEFNSAAPTREQWDQLRVTPPAGALRLLGTAQALQDLPARQALFVYVSWQDMLIRHLDLAAFVRQERMTHSRAQWLELRYRWDRVEAAVDAQVSAGAPGSVFALAPPARSVQALVRAYF